jgi:hypothetical protein
MIEMARAKSSRSGGSGRISTTRIVSTPMASAMSPRLNVAEAGKFDAAYGVCRSGGDVAHT